MAHVYPVAAAPGHGPAAIGYPVALMRGHPADKRAAKLPNGPTGDRRRILLVLYHPEPGTGDAEKLAMLASVTPGLPGGATRWATGTPVQ